MVQKVTWTERAEVTFLEAIGYLETNFSEVETEKFTARIQHKLLLLKNNPRLGRKSKRPNVFKTVINKRIVLLYQYKPIKKEVLLLAFWNTLQNPKKLKL